MRRILIVEDEKALAEIVRDYLVKENYEVVIKDSGESALAYLKEHAIDLLLLDIMLPGIDGYTICEEVRATSNVPIMIVSARHEEEDKLLGMELGADDYIEKPYSVKVLVMKIHAQIKRAYQIDKVSDKIEDGPLSMDGVARKVMLNSKAISMSTKEFDLLKLLMENKGRPLKKELLFNKVWGIDSDSDYATLTVHINRLREKIEKNVKKPERILTVWGVGYKYEGWS